MWLICHFAFTWKSSLRDSISTFCQRGCWRGSPMKSSLWDSISNRAFFQIFLANSVTLTYSLSHKPEHSLSFSLYLSHSHMRTHTHNHTGVEEQSPAQPSRAQRRHWRRRAQPSPATTQSPAQPSDDADDAEPSPAQRRRRRHWAQPWTPLLLEPSDGAESSFSLSLITTPIPIPILLGKFFIWFFVLIIVKFWVWIWILNI